ncbi:UNVERIFIED_CONTAM: hypothetical protein FKN15_013433 [Acipenser sinensis]
MDRNALAELLQALESRRDAEERRREERYTALIERWSVCDNSDDDVAEEDGGSLEECEFPGIHSSTDSDRLYSRPIG